MSMLRSPFKGGSGSGSTPDLRNLDKYIQRKRKNVDPEPVSPESDRDIRKEWNEFRKEIMPILRDQSSSSAQICQQITEIKNEFKNMNSIIEKLVSEQSELKNEINEMKMQNTLINDKVKSLEVSVTTIKNNSTTIENPPRLCNETIILELKDRTEREKNVIIAGICEKNIKNFEIRRKHDYEEVMKVMKSIDAACPDPLRILRLGKYTDGKHRLTKVCFQSAEIAKNILKNKDKINNSQIQIYTDKTLAQKEYLKHLYTELTQRVQKGESNLTVKYVNGTPKIIKQSKN